jgi:hypothetical protein
MITSLKFDVATVCSQRHLRGTPREEGTLGDEVKSVTPDGTRLTHSKCCIAVLHVRYPHAHHELYENKSVDEITCSDAMRSSSRRSAKRQEIPPANAAASISAFVDHNSESVPCRREEEISIVCQSVSAMEVHVVQQTKVSPTSRTFPWHVTWLALPCSG